LWQRGAVSGFHAVMLPMTDGRMLETYVSGPDEGIPLVFHNGTPSSGLPFAPFVELATDRGLRLVTYSRAGYSTSSRRAGRSVADIAADVAAVLDHLGAARCYTMGWSGGGPHALACSALLPERIIAAASLAGVAPYPAQGIDWMAGMGAENHIEFGAAVEGPDQLQPFLETAAALVEAVTGDQVAAAFGDLVSDVDRASLTGEYAEWVAAGFRDAVSHGIWGWFDDDLAFVKPWGFEINDIHRPVAIWQGGQDRMVPFAHGQWLAQHVPSASVHLLPEHGHLSLTVASMGHILDELVAAGA